MMYVAKYINNFDKKMYKKMLSNQNALRQLADAYIYQYSNPTYDCTIAFKESLDHYVLRKFMNDSSFVNTTEFRNYFLYLNYIFTNRVSFKNHQLEYNTNVVFSNEKFKDFFLMYYNNDKTKTTLELIISNNEILVNRIFDKIERYESISQDELTFISDYLYTKRDLDDPRYSKFIEYLLNNDNKELLSNPQIISAYASYLPKFFGRDCENSRFIFSNGFSKDSSLVSIVLPSELDKYKNTKSISYLGLYSYGDKYVSMGAYYLQGLKLTGDLSLDISRTMAGKSKYGSEDEKKEAEKYHDLYWLSMVTFHELTHQLQNKAMLSYEFNSSGLSQLVKIAKKNLDDYKLNHDSIETEIEADEVAWDIMFSFLMKYRSHCKSPNKDSEIITGQLKKCLDNKETVYARRAIRTKHNAQDSFFASDVKEIQAKINNPRYGDKYKTYFNSMLKRYPMLGRVFDENGKVKTSIMFETNFTSKNVTGNDENIMACELSGYILNDGYKALKYHLMNDDLTKNQVINLMRNVYNTYHLEKKYINSLNNLINNISFQLKETKTNFSFGNKDVLISKYYEKFRNVAGLVYKERELISIINKRYPEYKIEEIIKSKYGFWNYQDMFICLYQADGNSIDFDRINDILDVYERTEDPVLVELVKLSRDLSLIPESVKKNGVKKL